MITYLKNIKLRTKLLISFGFVLLVLSIQGADFIRNLSNVNSEIDTVVHDIQPALLSSKNLSEELKQASTSLGFYLLTKEIIHRTAYEDSINKLSDILEGLEKSPVIKELNNSEIFITKLNERISQFSAYRDQIYQLALGEKDTMIAAKYASENVNPIVMEISQMLSQAITAEEEEIASESRKQVLTNFNNLRYAWLSQVNEMRLFLAFRTQASKDNMSIYLDMVTSNVDKVTNLEDDLTFEQSDAIEQVTEKLATYKANLESLITMHESDKWRVDSWLIRTEINPLLNSTNSLISEFNKQLEARSETATVAVNKTYIDQRDRIIAGTAIIFIIISAVCFILIRSITFPIARAVHFANAIAEGKLTDKIKSDSTDETGQLLTALNTMRSRLRKRIESDRQMAAENGRVKQALDNVTGNVMIADADYNIIYMNNSVQAMFRDAEADLRTDLPNFSVDDLLGSNIDNFHKNKSHQRGLLDNLNETYKAEIHVGGRTMRMIANSVKDTDGTRLGTVVEWLDRTQESAVEHEIQDIINSSKSGDLSKRIDLTIQEGFTRRLSEGINQLVDVCNETINETVQVMSAIAQGDLTRKIETDYEGSFGQLKSDVNATVDKLTEIMSKINTSAVSVKSDSQEIAQGNTNLSVRTEQQASSLEETASSMEEMTSTVKQNADNAQQANQLASGARNQAEQGGTVVNQAVSAMSEITESSNKIAAIIGVIDEIAFQTNLLALNAAVEAARAGEQGRGFAVVASEVRNLAGRSATAAKEIKDLIEDSVIKVGEGSKLVDDSGKTLEEIMTSVKKVSDIIAEIAAASQEQSEGIEQVNMAITQMDEMTQQNAALVEEATAASESMGEQAGTLSEMVGFFKTGKSATTAVVTERRKADRPWSAQVSQNNPSSAVKTANGNDEEWEEF